MLSTMKQRSNVAVDWSLYFCNLAHIFHQLHKGGRGGVDVSGEEKAQSWCPVKKPLWVVIEVVAQRRLTAMLLALFHSN